jgi:hypothetical protein
MEPAFAGVERSEEACAGCGARLAEAAEPIYASLISEGEGWRRRDYCAPCFEKLPARPYSFWRRSKAAPVAVGASKEEKRDRRRRDLDALVELFERLGGPEALGRGPDAAKLRYLLALALVRKKRLHLVDLAREGGADCLVIRASGDADLITVPAPALSKEELEKLAVDLEQEVGLS